jgi:hypothetical protein
MYFNTEIINADGCTVNYIRFGVFMAVTMKNAVFWDVAPCRSCVNGGTSVHIGSKRRQIPEDGILHVNYEFISLNARMNHAQSNGRIANVD